VNGIYDKSGIYNRLQATNGFSNLALRYWLKVYPRVAREMSYWKMRASRIPDPLLRELALDAHRTKSGHVEGAAIFAALVPRARRQCAIRLIVAWQAAYDYIDSVSEQPCADPQTNGRQLHLALLQALKAGPLREDYYAHFDHDQDDEYLTDLIRTARDTFVTLPHRELVGKPIRRAATRIVDYQALNQTDQAPLARWAKTHIPPGVPVRWWEIAAASASSLAVLALIATAADPASTRSDTNAIEHAYFPWIGALNTLLDSLVDLQEDANNSRFSLLDYYSSPHEAAERMRMLARQSMKVARALPHGKQHALILAGMSSFYLAMPEAQQPAARQAAENIESELAPIAGPWMLMHRARRKTRSFTAALLTPLPSRAAIEPTSSIRVSDTPSAPFPG
jgi:tetraprenyl-beta-curcumene synthase